MNKNRYKYYVAIVIVILIVTIGVDFNYGIGAVETGNINGESEEIFLIGNKEYPMWTDYKNLDNRQYTYVIKDKNKEVLNNLGGFEYRTIENNIQVIQVPYPNANDPFDLSPLKDESHFYKNFELDGNKVVKTSKTSYKVRWETSMGFKYETTYEKSPYIKNSMVGTKNQNYKTQGSDVQTKLPIENGGVRPFIYQNKQGNIRKIIDYTQGGIEAHFIYYNADLVNLKTGWLIDNRNLVKEPWNVYNDIELGKVTDDYLNGKIDDQDAQLIYLNFLKHYSGLRGNLENKGAIKGDPNFDVAARLSQTKKFFEYANIQEKPDKNVSGRAQVGYRGKSSLNYATIVTPAVSSINNLELYDVKLFDADTNEAIEIEKIEDVKFGKIDKFKIPSSIENIKVKYRYGYLDSEKRNINVKSLNSQIVTNLYFYNDKFEGTFSKQSILGNKTGHLKGYYAFDPKEYLKRAEELNISDFMTLVSMYPEIELLREEELDTFEVIIPVSELEKSGYIMPNLPWQFDNYGETKEYFGRQIYKDNAFKFDDVGYAKYEISTQPKRDIKLQNLTGLGEWDEELKKYKVISGKTYTVKVEVINNGTADTLRINPTITWEATNMNSMGASQVRVNESNRTNPTNPKVLKKDSTDTLSYQITVKIPDNAEDGDLFNLGVAIQLDEDNYDNIFIVSDDFIKIDTVVSNTLGTADIGIEDIVLKANGKTYNDLVASPNFYRIDSLTRTYTAEITVKKYSGEAQVLNPRITFGSKAHVLDSGYNSGEIRFNGTLNNVGDTLTKEITITTANQYFDLIAEINNEYHLNTTPRTNKKNSNDKLQKLYVAGFDFTVSDVNVSPSKASYCAKSGENYFKSEVSVQADINVLSYSSGSFDLVPVKLELITPNGSQTIIESKVVDLKNGANTIEFIVPDRIYKQGNYAYKVIVNTPITYFESNYNNNSKAGVLSIKSCPPTPPTYCWGGAPNTRNDWEVKHSIIEREKYPMTYTRCTHSDSDGNCLKYTKYKRCTTKNQINYDGNPNPKKYSEKLNLKGYVSSVKTDWNWDLGKSEVDAGRAFGLKFELEYYNNRVNIPNTERRLSNGSCGGDYTTNRATMYLFSTPLYLQISGYDFPEGNILTLYGKTSGSWNNKKITYELPLQTDALSDYSRLLYTDLNTSNRTISIKAWTDKIDGYPILKGEDNGFNMPLIDCEIITIRINNSIDINKKTIK